MAENAVKSFKSALKKSSGDLEDRLFRYLFDYRITPHATTGIPPCELLMKRKIKCRFDLLRPSVDGNVRKRQESQVQNYGGNRSQVSGSSPDFAVGDHVYYTNYSRVGAANIPGTVVENTGPVSCKVRSENGQLLRKHFVQLFRQRKPEDSVNGQPSAGESSLQPSEESDPASSVVPDSPVPDPGEFSGTQSPRVTATSPVTNRPPGDNFPTPSVTPRKSPAVSKSGGGETVLRRSSRVSRPVNKMNL